MEQQLLDLTKKLISIPSVEPNKDAMIDVLNTAKTILTDYPFEPFASKNVPSLLFANSKEYNRKFKIILNAHLDVVPGTSDQYKPLEKDGKLYGRGAYDMKSGAAAMILLFKEIGHMINYPLALQLTTDEEGGGTNGTEYQVKQGVRAEFILTGEGTCYRIINEAKAITQIKLTARGKSAHSAYPWLGENAIWKMQEAIKRLYDTFPPPQSESKGTTVTLISIHSENISHTRIPDKCEAIIDIRVIAAEKNTIFDKIKSVIGEGITVEIIRDSMPHLTNPKNPYISKLQKIIYDIQGTQAALDRAHGQSDVRHFTNVGCDGIEFGPIGGSHHADNEWLDIKSLYSYYTVLKNFLLF